MEPVPGTVQQPGWQDYIAPILGGVAGALIGGQDQPDTVSRPFMYPGQEQLGGQFMASAAAEYGLGPQQYYPGQQVASLDPNTVAGQNALLGSTNNMQQLADLSSFGAADLVNGGAGRIGPLQLPDQAGWGIPTGLQDAVTNPIMQRLQEQVLPGIQQSATGQGAFGGTRMMQMQNNAIRDASGQMADSLARANLSARGQDIQQRGQDINAALQGRGQDINQNNIYNQAVGQGLRLIPQSMNNLLAPGNTMMDVGQQRTAYEQALINADMDRFNFNQTAPLDALTRLGERISMRPPPGGVTLQGQDATWLDYLGGAATGVGIINSIFGEDKK